MNLQKGKIMSRSAFVALLLTFMTVGCSTADNGNNTRDKDFIIRVDSVEAPSSASSSDTLHITLHGIVGPDGCYRFDHIEADRQPDTLKLTAWGIHHDGICTQAVVALHEPYRIDPPLEDPFVIAVRQPDGSVLKNTVRIYSP